MTATCSTPSCDQATREGKPFCPDHVERNGYAQQLLAQIAAQEGELAAVRQRGAAAVDLQGEGARQVLVALRASVARQLPLEELRVDGDRGLGAVHVDALQRAGLVVVQEREEIRRDQTGKARARRQVRWVVLVRDPQETPRRAAPRRAAPRAAAPQPQTRDPLPRPPCAEPAAEVPTPPPPARPSPPAQETPAMPKTLTKTCKTCKTCEEDYEPTSNAQRYCSDDCNPRLTTKARPAKPAAKPRPAKPELDEEEPVAGECRVCGCTDDDCNQCARATGEPCSWVEEDLCSRCADEGAPQLPALNGNGHGLSLALLGDPEQLADQVLVAGAAMVRGPIAWGMRFLGQLDQRLSSHSLLGDREAE